MTEQTIILPPGRGGNGIDANYQLKVMIPKRRFLSYLRDRWWVVLLCLALTVGLVLVYETVRMPTYDSYAELLVGDEQVNMANIFTEDSMNYYGTQIELLKSARLQNAAYDRVNLGSVAADKGPIALQVERPMGTAILQLRATGREPDLTQRYLQALIDEYHLFKKDSRNSTSGELLNSLNLQVQEQKDTLETNQDKWAEFQKSNNVAVLEEEGKSLGLYLAELRLDLEKYGLERELLSNAIAAAQTSNQDLFAAGGAWETNSFPSNTLPVFTNGLGAASSAIESQTNAAALSDALAASTNVIVNETDADLKSLRVQLRMLVAERDNRDSRAKLGGLKRYDETIESVTKRISFLEDQDLMDKRNQLEELKNRISVTAASLPALTTNVLAINERLSEAERLRSNLQREQAHYDQLLALFRNADLSRNVQQERLSIVQAPTPAQPTRRNLPFRLALAVAGGLAMSLGIVFAWHLLDDRFSSFHDVKDQFGEEILGLVPQIKVRRSKPRQALLVEGDTRHAYRESFRHLRSALLLSSGVENRPQTLLFTGVTSGEGKTTVAVNLARTLARSGLRVVVVDADVHVGGVHQLLGAPSNGHPGLLDYLRGQMDARAIVQPTEIPGLSFIGSGSDEEHAEGLFLHPRLGELMKELRQDQDFVIIDGAPVLAADNAALLVPHADCVVLVVRPFFTRSRLLRQGLAMLYQRQARQVFLVFNQARADDLGGRYAKNGRSPNWKNGHSNLKPEQSKLG